MIIDHCSGGTLVAWNIKLSCYVLETMHRRNRDHASPDSTFDAFAAYSAHDDLREQSNNRKLLLKQSGGSAGVAPALAALRSTADNKRVRSKGKYHIFQENWFADARREGRPTNIKDHKVRAALSHDWYLAKMNSAEMQKLDQQATQNLIEASATRANAQPVVDSQQQAEALAHHSGPVWAVDEIVDHQPVPEDIPAVGESSSHTAPQAIVPVDVSRSLATGDGVGSTQEVASGEWKTFIAQLNMNPSSSTDVKPFSEKLLANVSRYPL